MESGVKGGSQAGSMDDVVMNQDREDGGLEPGAHLWGGKEGRWINE